MKLPLLFGLMWVLGYLVGFGMGQIHERTNELGRKIQRARHSDGPGCADAS